MNKALALALVLVFLALSSIVDDRLLLAMSEVDTAISISVPISVEVAQAVNIKILIEPLPPSATDHLHGLTLTVTRPDGVKNTYEPLESTDGYFYWSYMINQLGNYSIQCSYAGEFFSDGTVKYKPSQSAAVILIGIGDALPPVESQGGSWTRKQSMNQARGYLGVVGVNGKIYAIGGSINNGTYSTQPTSGLVATNEEYNPDTDTWTTKTSMPTPRCDFAVASCQNKVYCIGGIVGSKLDDTYHLFTVAQTSGVNEVYDPATNMWETKASLPVGRSGVTAHVVGERIYIIEGNTVWVYDPVTDSWAKNKDAPIQADGYVSAIVSNKIYFVGNYAPVQIYNTLTDSWSQGARSPRMDPRGSIAATTGVFAPQRIFFFTVAQYGWVPYGKTDTSPPDRRTTFVYNPQTDNWSAGTVMPDYRLSFGVVVLNDYLFAVGGYVFDNLANNNVTASKTNVRYTPIGYGNPASSPPNFGPTSSPTPSPSIPEVQPWTIPLLLIIMVAAGLLVYHKKHKHSLIIQLLF